MQDGPPARLTTGAGRPSGLGGPGCARRLSLHTGRAWGYQAGILSHPPPAPGSGQHPCFRAMETSGKPLLKAARRPCLTPPAVGAHLAATGAAGGRLEPGDPLGWAEQRLASSGLQRYQAPGHPAALAGLRPQEGERRPREHSRQVGWASAAPPPTTLHSALQAARGTSCLSRHAQYKCYLLRESALVTQAS